MYWHIYMESKERTLMNLFSGEQWRNRHREQTWGHSGRRGGRRGAVWREQHRNLQCHMYNRHPMGICCMTQGTQQGLWDRLKGRVGRKMRGRSRREGTWVYLLWLILVDVRQKTTKFCKAIILQLKKIFFNEKYNLSKLNQEKFKSD